MNRKAITLTRFILITATVFAVATFIKASLFSFDSLDVDVGIDIDGDAKSTP